MEIAQACLDLAKIIFRDRDLGTTQTVGTAEGSVTRSTEEANDVLRSIDGFRATGLTVGVNF